MQYLKQIQLSNIRKFAELVNIPISNGATIFLAPNGTGKTSIFEAIELALTGDVRRLDPPPYPIIKESVSSAFIKLVFEDDHYCQATFNRGEQPVLSGDHRLLFGDRNVVDIPFLLRITHLLDQRASEWFVQTQGESAGSMLDKLSINRDVTRVSGTMTSAKRAANQLLAREGESLDGARSRIAQWNELIDKRTKTSPATGQAPAPLELLKEKVNTLLVSFPTISPVVEPKLETIRAKINELSVGIQRGEEFNHNHLVALLEQQDLAGTWDGIFNAQMEANQKLGLAQHSVTGLETRLKKITEEEQQKVDAMNRLEANLNLLQDHKALYDIIDSLNRQKQTGESKFVQLQTDLEKLEHLEKDRRAALDVVESVNGKHGECLSRIEALQRNEHEAKKRIELTVLWTQLLGEIQSKEGGLATLRNQYDLTKAQQVKANEVRLKLLNDVAAAQLTFDQINNASGEIKAAVGIIATNLSKEDTSCPVCQSEFQAYELQRRIQQALENIDPSLQRASINLQKVKSAAVEADGAYRIIERNLQLLDELLQSRTFEIRSVESRIESEIKSLFPKTASPEEAAKKIDEVLNECERSIRKISEEKSALPPFVDDDKKAVISSALRETSQEMASKKEQLRIQGELIKSLDAEIYQLNSRKPQDYSFQEILVLIENEKKTVDAAREGVKAFGLERLAVTVDLDKARVEMHSIQAEVDLRGQRTAASRARWVAAGFPNDPSLEFLENQKNTTESDLQSLNAIKGELDSVEVECAKWMAYEQFFEVEREISELRGEKSVEEHTAYLEQNLSAQVLRFEKLSKRVETLETFSQKVREELENINDRLSFISEPWNKLLRRVVLDPRFSEVVLNSYSYYNKPHADVQVPFGNERIRVSDLASEAQITDLQLTFLLTMAKTYQWNNWKGLLLDDPTQHHDLVHAAAVFDLLRDYISKKGFQVVLGTHDSVHANFFLRKLKNDGIESSLWGLKSKEGGVTVEQLG